MELVLLVIGGFTYYIFKSIEPPSPQTLAYIREVKGLAELSAKAEAFQVQLEALQYDDCSICGRRSVSASKCEKSHLQDVKQARVREGLQAFKAQENWVYG